MNLAFGLDLDKDVVRRILAIHYRPEQGTTGPSWLTTLGHTKDSLWQLELAIRHGHVLTRKESLVCKRLF